MIVAESALVLLFVWLFATMLPTPAAEPGCSNDQTQLETIALPRA